MDFALLIPLLAILIVGIIVLVPIAGLTARFALKPAIEAFAQLRGAREQEQLVAVLEQRISLLEQQMHGMETSLRILESHALPAAGERPARQIPLSKTVP
jgi:hypothetical protein